MESMNSYQSNPILEFIRSQDLEVPNLQRVYQLWDAAKSGTVPFLSSSGACEWFGHSLFTANVKVYLGQEELRKMLNLFSSDPKYPVVPLPQSAIYGIAPSTAYSESGKQIDRYSCLSTFFGHLFGALDVMTVGLAYLYDFKQIDPLKIDFPKLLRKVKEASMIAGKSKPTGLIDVFKTEGLLDTGCTWYEDLKDQRNYFTHIGFPMLYMVEGEWRLPTDVRSATPVSDLTPSIPDFCHKLLMDVRRFIGDIYYGAWCDFSPSLS